MSSNTERTERTDDSRASQSPRTLCLRGILPGDGRCLRLDGPAKTIGRASGVDLLLEVPRVSRKHAELRREGPIYTLHDLGSTNGTFLDGRAVQYACVEAGSLLRIGDFLGMFEELSSTEQATVPRELAPGILGGRTLAAALARLKRAAAGGLPVVLVGATGTGKELFARAFHDFTGRKGPLHVVNCAAVPVALAEAELFGHTAGAYTGAQRARTGHLQSAEGGTLFLDEALELPLAIQAKLLRALDQQELFPLGDTRSIRFDARIVLACQDSLEQAVSKGSFRSDLAARVSGLVLELPDLRARRSDLPSLFHHFVSKCQGERRLKISTKVYESVCLSPWPGNARELSMFAHRLVAELGAETVIRRHHLPEDMGPASDDRTKGTHELRAENRRQHDTERLVRALKDESGNLTLAANRAGISRQRAYRLLARLPGSDLNQSGVVRDQEPLSG